MLTIHNNPEDLTLAPGVKHLRQVLADTDSADISQYFNAAYEFINEGVQKQQREWFWTGRGGAWWCGCWEWAQQVACKGEGG